MSPVGGSRHYGGPGLGDTLTWGCPSCGADNTGPITQGCQLCGAGKPGQRVEELPEPPPAADPRVAQGDVADYWASQHPEATVAEAYRAGLMDGVRAAREAAARTTVPPAVVAQLPAESKAARTIIAALALFRDQVLIAGPEEIRSGEWCSLPEVDALIEQIQQQYEVEVTHA